MTEGLRLTWLDASVAPAPSPGPAEQQERPSREVLLVGGVRIVYQVAGECQLVETPFERVVRPIVEHDRGRPGQVDCVQVRIAEGRHSRGVQLPPRMPPRPPNESRTTRQRFPAKPRARIRERQPTASRSASIRSSSAMSVGTALPSTTWLVRRIRRMATMARSSRTARP